MNISSEKLLTALETGNIETLKLLNGRFDINYRLENNDGDTLLLYALSNPDNKLYKYLLNNGADITLVNNEMETAVHSIVYSGLVERLLEVVSLHKLDINLQSEDGSSPLLLSLLLEKYEIAHALIGLGADIYLADSEGNMPIHIACFFGYEPIVRELVEKGVRLDIKTNKGNLPLSLAVNGGHVAIVKYLYQKIYN